jgi:SAM-dependent methyltransferase
MRTDDYFLAVGERGLPRMQILNDVYAPHSLAFLAHDGSLRGKRVLDVGVGTGLFTRLLAREVGPEGRVVGVDQSADQVAFAARHAQPGLSFSVCSSYDLASIEGQFDLVHARWLLLHSTAPADAIAAMKAKLAPGGALVLEDCVTDSAFCYPESRAFGKFIDGWLRVSARRGIDPHVGDALVPLVRNAGLRVTRYAVFQPLLTTPEQRSLIRSSFEETAGVHVECNVYSEREIAATVAELRDVEQGKASLGFVRNVSVRAEL